MDAQNKFKCSFCNQTFNHKQCLHNHFSKYHLKEIAAELDSEYNSSCVRNGNHGCTLCDRKFKNLRSLRRHERTIHNIISPKFTNRLKCPMCEFATPENAVFFNHIETNHNITIITKELSFQRIDEFNDWKEGMEKETFARFVKKNGNYKGVSYKKYYYGCHRSGVYVPSGKNKKSLKAKGSKKINGTCPAEIVLKEADDGTCKVKFVQTHVGHENEIFHLYLTEKEKKSIAKDILNEVPFDEILNRVRDSATQSSLERIHLLTKKDLHNIKRSLNSTWKNDFLSGVAKSTVGQQSDDDSKNDNDDYNNDNDDYNNDNDGDEMIVEEQVEEVASSQDTGVNIICEIITTEEQDFDFLANSTQNDNLLYLDIENHYDPTVTHQISKKELEESISSLTAKKEKLKTRYLSLLDSVQSEKEFEVFEKNLTEIETALKTARSPKVSTTVLQNRVELQNKNVAKMRVKKEA